MPTRPLRVPTRFPLVPDPPYTLTGCRSFVFAVPANLPKLQDLVDTTYDWAQPDVDVQAIAPVVLVAWMDIAQAAGVDPNEGHFAYKECTVFVPVRVDIPGQASRWAFHVPFIYPDHGMAQAAGREVYGLPKKPGQLDIPPTSTFWNGNQSLRLRALAAKHLNGTGWTDRQVLRVSTLGQTPVGGALGALLGLLFPGAGVALGDIDIVAMKQFPDVRPGSPERSVYRAVTFVDAPVQALSNIRLADPLKVTVRTESLATEPLRDVLGLPLNSTPLAAASLDVDFQFQSSQVLYEEPIVPAVGEQVLVLGGGLAGLVAAYHLTDPARPGEYQVTVVQQGHLLGGKGASWRNPAHHDRIEEHGVHVIFGFYENFLLFMEQVYSELGRDPTTTFPATYEQAFLPIDKVVLNTGTHDYTVHLPSNPRNWDHDEPDTLVEVGQDLWLWLQEFAEFSGETLVNIPATLASPVAHDLFGYVLTLAKGIFLDARNGKTAEDLDAEDFRAWLKRHDGWLIPGDSWDGPAAQVPYDGIFSYPGTALGNGDVSAWVAAWGMARLLRSYRGSPYYFMNAGMGEAVFAPIYELLVARGVRFEFMSKATEVELAGGKVSRVRIERQETINGGADQYQPLIVVDKTPTWPKEPLAAQMSNGGIGGGDPYSDATNGSTSTLDLHDGTDFVHVICALPAPVTASVLTGTVPAELAGIASIETVATVALQVWTTDSLADLGWAWGQTALGAFAQPLNSMMTCDRILPLESWGAGGPKGCLYLSGPLADAWTTDPTVQAERNAADAAAASVAVTWMTDHLAKLLPGADDGTGQFDFTFERDRYVRANIDHWQRFTLARTGSLAFRPEPHKTGIANLTVAGDWTRNGLDIPCMEATTISAMMAVQAITGDDPGIVRVAPKRPTSVTP